MPATTRTVRTAPHRPEAAALDGHAPRPRRSRPPDRPGRRRPPAVRDPPPPAESPGRPPTAGRRHPPTPAARSTPGPDPPALPWSCTLRCPIKPHAKTRGQVAGADHVGASPVGGRGEASLGEG